MADEKRDESFRVVDRRLFTEQGELRQDVVEQQERERAQAEAKLNATATPAPDASAQAARETPVASRSFQVLVDFLARNALALLGGYADPRTGQAVVDLDGAREVIDMLDALREKTRGNVTPEEERLLSEILNSLKLTYVEVSRAAAQAMRESTSGQGKN